MLQTLAHRSKNRGSGSLSIRDVTREVEHLSDFDCHEQVVLGEDRERGLTALVALHDTTLGPGFGGTRIWPYATLDAAATDVLRLSRGMTFKAAISGLPFGGGKAVIMADAKRDKSSALLAAYADMLAALQDIFITAEDVGMTVADTDFLRQRTGNVCGTTIGGSGNPASFTAEGVFLGIQAAARHRLGADSLEGLHVAVQGLGAVGWALCEKLHAAGALLSVADISVERVENAVTELGARKVSADAIHSVEADIFAPCALGGVISHHTIPALKAAVVAGSANNQLAFHADAMALKGRGLLYAPDYVINAGGLINAADELSPGGYDRDRVVAQIARIPATLEDIFDEADQTRLATNDVAETMARKRIAAAR